MAHPPLTPSVHRRRRLVAVLIGVAVLAVAGLRLRPPPDVVIYE